MEKQVLRVGGDGEPVDSGGDGKVQCGISPFFSHLSQIQRQKHPSWKRRHRLLSCNLVALLVNFFYQKKSLRAYTVKSQCIHRALSPSQSERAAASLRSALRG